MKNLFPIIIVLFLLATFKPQAQQVFIAKGKIEFEKQTNMHKEIDDSWGADDDNIWKQNYKKILPKIQTTYFDLFFNEEKTLYKVGRDAPQGLQKVPEWMMDRTTDNIIYNDLKLNQTTSQKNVFESNFLIVDSLRKIDWRITSDTRTIAGIECRKAIGKIMDSVYVIAFYADIIENSGGPESFTGLPGMILGIAVPRLNTTWFATKVELVEIKETDLAIPKKGKKSNYAELQQQLKKSTKDWGKNAERSIWKMMI
ncbi:MAG: GLPGLI family protein [Chitinophagaceae bacterium]|nr:GLPGLI family protein [Chitinophagaceae bacterium]